MRFNPMTAVMNNSPIGQMLSALKSGGNPQALVQQMIDNHPQKEQLMKIVDGKTPDQLMSVAENMCRERGTTVDEVLKQYGIER